MKILVVDDDNFILRVARDITLANVAKDAACKYAASSNCMGR